MAVDTRIMTSRPHAPGRHQRRGQRPDCRGYNDCIPWGQGDWGSGGSTPPAGGVATGATDGEPGVWTPPGSTAPLGADLLAGVPHVYVATPTTDWAGWVTTSDPGTPGTAFWIAGAWDVTFGSFADGTIAEVQSSVEDQPMGKRRAHLAQVLVDYERAHKNRATLVTWLDEQTGVV